MAAVVTGPFASHAPARGFGNPQGFHTVPGPAAGGSYAAQRMRRLLLETKPPELKLREAMELVHSCGPQDVGACVSGVLDLRVQLPATHTLGLQVLTELLRLFPGIMVSQFEKSHVYDLFPENGDVEGASSFLHSLLKTKESFGRSAQVEAAKLQKLLLERTRQKDLRRVPSSPVRAWLTQIWLDVPSTRPRRELLVRCCATWVADSTALASSKLPSLELLRQEFAAKSPAEAEPWLLTLLLEQVCRDPSNHSPDLQQLLYFLKAPPSGHTLRELLQDLSQEKDRLATLWVCLCLWAPQPPPDATRVGWPSHLPAPIHALLRGILVSYAQLYDSKTLCRTCLMSLAAIAASGSGAIAAAAPQLLLLLYKEGPVLPPDVWMPMAPLLEAVLAHQSSEAAELLGRLGRGSGGFAVAPARALGGERRPWDTAPAPQLVKVQEAHSAWNAWNTAPQAPAPALPAPEPPAQAAQGAPPAAPSSVFQTLPAESTVAVAHQPPHVGLQNTNNTCYMNSFIQGLYLTDAFIWRLFSFKLRLKDNPSKVDQEDFEFGTKLVELLQRQVAKMSMTRHPNTDIWDMLQSFPDIYRSGEQQDVTETIRFVFEKLGSFEQPLIREVFAGQLVENLQCKVCGHIKAKPETFTDLVLSVPTEEQVKAAGSIPTTQALLEDRLKFEELDADCLVNCDRCQDKRQMGKWCEIVSPPCHICICLNRFTFNVEKMDFTKEKTPVRVDGPLKIGPYEYELYHVIIHTGKDASSGHYYAVGRRSEPVGSGDTSWYTMDDSQIKPAELGLLQGNPPEKLKDDNPYVLFYRCKNAPATPALRIPKKLESFVKKEDAKRE